ncbi:MAG: response regulator transcription factor [Firmicutes bacterium]|nr:response regulator transcription factor [Bacillota bacterium]
MGKYKILVVEDEKDISDGVKLFLSHMGYEVQQAFNGKDAIRFFNSFKPHVILLDTLLPDIRGTELCTEFASEDVGIIFLTALSAKNNIVEGFKRGADDYIAKPFDLDILLARIEALINRLDINTEDKNGVIFDMLKNDVFIEGKELFLTKMEFRVFHCLYKSEDYISADEILESIDEGFSSGVSTRTVSVHIANIRKKLFEAGFENMEIVSKYKVGYKIDYL